MPLFIYVAENMVNIAASPSTIASLASFLWTSMTITVLVSLNTGYFVCL